MEKLRLRPVLSAPIRKSCEITTFILKKKAKLSAFHLYEKLNFKTLHYGKYYEQIVGQPDETAEKMSENIVEKSNEAVKEQRSKKKRWLSTVFMLLNLGIVVGILLYNFLGTSEPLSLSELLSTKINWLWLAISIVVFFAIFIFDSFGIYILIGHVTKRSRPFLSYKSHAMCRFYDSVTPMATGGQPFQVYYLTKRGVSPGAATSVPIAKYLYTQFYTVIFMAVILIMQHNYIITLSPFILTLCYIGFALSAIVIGSVMFLSFSKKVAPAFTIGILKLLHKMHIVKDYRKSFVKVMHTVREYVVTMRQFIKNWWIAVGMLISRAISFVLTYSVPFFVYAVFMPLGADWFDVFIKLFTIAVVCDLACCFIPLPGATGMAEISFAVLFAGFFVVDGSNSLAVWALLLWRILTYYGILLQGLIIMFYDFLIGNKKVKPLLARFKKEDEQNAMLDKKRQPIKVITRKKNDKGEK